MKRLLMTLLFALWATPLLAGQFWEAPLTVRSGGAENKLSFGQWPDATDGLDGFSDVPAFAAGSLKAWFELEDKRLWRDIRSLEPPKPRSWALRIDSAPLNQPVNLSWKPAALPNGYTVLLTGMKGQSDIDMKKQDHLTIRWTKPLVLQIKTHPQEEL